MALCRYCGLNKYNPDMKSTICSSCTQETFEDLVDLAVLYMGKGHTLDCAWSMALCKPCSCGLNDHNVLDDH